MYIEIHVIFYPTDISGIRQKSMSWLYEDVHLGTGALHWEEGHDELPEERANHCQLQINDCEVAFIGGVRGPDLAATSTDIIDIWNFEERTWRYGPRYVNIYCIMNHCLFLKVWT